MTPEQRKELEALTTEFWQWVDQCYGIYRDAHEAFPGLAKAKMAYIEENRKYGDLRPEDIIIAYPRLQKAGTAPPRHLHQAGLPEVAARNAHEGPNTKFIGRMVIVAIYSFWEDHTRPRMEKLLGVALQVPIMGEIAVLRNAVVHNRARTSELKKLNILSGLEAGEYIDPSEPQISKLVDGIHQFLSEFINKPENFFAPKNPESS